jgi:hypothetical protein
VSSLALTARQAQRLTIPLLAATIGVGLVLLYLLLPQPAHVWAPPPPVKTAVVPAPEADDAPPGATLSSAPVPQLAPAVYPRPARLMPTGDPTEPAAQRLIRFLVQAQLTDEQKQLFFGLL